MGDNTKV